MHVVRGESRPAGRTRRRPLENRTATRRSRRGREHTGRRGLTPSPIRPDTEEQMGTQEQTAETAMNEESSALSRRGLFVSGGLLAAGLGAFGAEGIASAAST